VSAPTSVLASARVQVLVLALGLLSHGLFHVVPAAKAVWGTNHGRDFASYYYAVEAATHGGDPYATRELGAMARAEHTRQSVNPYFYPPPFLFTVAWAAPLDLPTAYRAMFVLNEALLGACLFVLARGFAVPLGVLGAILVAWSPIPDNAKMGQANLIALLPALLGLWAARTRPWLGGVLLGAAAMFKMSPALFLLYWALKRRWRPCIAATATAVGLTLLSLPLCPVAIQVEFYRDVLPGFARGDYFGLEVPIGLAANHSIPDIFNTLFPGTSKTALSPTALLCSRAAILAALGTWAWRASRSSSPTADIRLLGALTVLMVIIPTYAYEHHLVFLLLPLAALLTSAWDDVTSGDLHPARDIASVVAVIVAGWPLALATEMIAAAPAWSRLPLREVKFVALLVIFGLLLSPWTRRSARA